MSTPEGNSSEDQPRSRDLERLDQNDLDQIADAVARKLGVQQPPSGGPPMEVRVTDYMSYVAPLPPPEWYDGYEQVVPGAGHRILTMVEEEGRHRRYMDRAFVKYRFGGLVCALVVTLAVIGSGVFLIQENKKVYGFALIIANVVALTTVFFTREIKQRNGNGE